MSVHVITEFDGACPASSAAIQSSGENSWVFTPSYGRDERGRDGAVPSYFRMDARLQNDGVVTIPVEIVVDWKSNQRWIRHHDTGYVRGPGDADWTMIPGLRRQERTYYHLDLRPGLTEFGRFPAYNVEACRAFTDRAQAAGAKVSVVGQSEEGRDIWLLSLPSPDEQAPAFVVQTRDHPYETAGSYCVEGIVEFLLGNDPVAQYLRHKFQVHILPMTNPDGVFNGLDRFTAEQGADLNRLVTADDTAHDAIRTTLDRLQPIAYMNIHNYLPKFKDGMYAHQPALAELLGASLPPDQAHHKRWDIITHQDYLDAENVTSTPPEKQSWKNYCADRFGAAAVTFEFPWFSRNTADMRQLGARSFTALGLATLELNPQ